MSKRTTKASPSPPKERAKATKRQERREKREKQAALQKQVALQKQREDRAALAAQKASEMGWSWRFPSFFKEELGINETRYAELTGVRRPTLNELRYSRDSYVSVLVALYFGARQIKPDTTLHDLITVEGQPELLVPHSWEVHDEMQPLPGLPGIYLNTATLRRKMVSPDAPPMTFATLGAECGLSPASLWQMETGMIQPKVSTLIRIYQFCLTRLPTLTLHDVLLITPESEHQPVPEPLEAQTKI